MQKNTQNTDPVSPAALLAQCPAHKTTPLLNYAELAKSLGIVSLLVKDEGHRALGSFKSLGGTYAGLCALARHMEMSVEELFNIASEHKSKLPHLVCASDGNHGLAVAAAARMIGGQSKIYLHKLVPQARIDRVTEQGADVIIVDGSYDDAVLAAGHAAASGEGVLIADTGEMLNDPVVADVMSGYGVIADEIRAQIGQYGFATPTHVFVQAGVGGLAAAIADGLTDMLAAPARIIIVEPSNAACVAPALLQKKAIQIEGDLETSADMLSCGLASTPALQILLDHKVSAIEVSEEAIASATAMLNAHQNINTTPSGATGFAGLLSALSLQSKKDWYGVGPDSRVLIIATETAA